MQNVPLQRFAEFAWQLGGVLPNVASPYHAKKRSEAYWLKFVQEWFLQIATLRLVLGEGPQGRKEWGIVLVRD
jgi:hypothetical protein